MNDALDLINRQKAEIERLQKIKENSLEIISMGEKQMLEIRKNSIKEFAEEVIAGMKERYYECDFAEFCGHVNNLVKEMAGEG